MKKIITLQTTECFNFKNSSSETVFYVGSDLEFLKKHKDSIILVSDYYDKTIETVKNFLINIDACFSDSVMMLHSASSANRYLSPLFDDLLAAYTLLYLISFSTKKNIWVVLEDSNKILAISDFLKKNRCKVFINKSDNKKLLYSGIKVFYKFIKTNVSFVKNYFKIKKYKKDKIFHINDSIFITWLPSPEVISESTLYKNNRYFGNIPEYINKNNTVSFLGLTIDGDKDDNKRHEVIDKNKLPVWFIYSFSSFTDLIFSLYKNVCVILFLFKQFYLEKINVTTFVNRALIYDLSEGKYLKSLLYYRCFFKILSLISDEASIFYPFENQPWEKALLLAKKKKKSKITCFAYQFFPIPKNFSISSFSNKAKYLGCVPDKFLSSDANTHEDFLFQDFQVSPLGSSRYKEIISNNIKNRSAVSRMPILCSLFLDPKEAIPLLKKSIKLSALLNIPLWVNYHPMLPVDIVQKIKNIILEYPHVELKNESVSELLSETCVQLYNSSSVCYEAALRGTPPIYVSCEGLPDLNRLPNAVKCFSDIKDGENILKNLLFNEKVYQEYVLKMSCLAKKILFPLELGLLEKV